MAEALFRDLVRDRQDVAVSSAGTKSRDGFDPSPEALAVLRTFRIDTSDLRTNRLTRKMIQQATHIFPMEIHQGHAICEMDPKARERCFLLGDFAEETDASVGMDVPDPHGQDLDAYVEVYKILKRVLPNVLEFIDYGPTEDLLDRIDERRW